jgi:mono/diheme cytochrome c family protein
MKKSFVLLLVLAAAPLVSFPLAAQDNSALRSDLTGVYTVAQAERGHQIYLSRCQRCHSVATNGGGGGGGAPAFGGATFTADFEGDTLFAIENRINTSMPADEPGSTNRVQATDLVAFILSMTRVPPGRVELPPDGNFLRLIRFDKPK